jgi:hypothetical protein
MKVEKYTKESRIFQTFEIDDTSYFTILGGVSFYLMSFCFGVFLLCVILLNVILLSVSLPNVFMISVILLYGFL